MAINTTNITVEIKDFIDSWEDAGGMKESFVTFWQTATLIPDVTLQFVARPGVSYSLRPKHSVQSGRPFFASIDVIDDDPEDRWISICFFGDMVTDPEGKGEVIPGGLPGSDGYCFDMYAQETELVAYLVERIQEAAATAIK